MSAYELRLSEDDYRRFMAGALGFTVAFAGGGTALAAEGDTIETPTVPEASATDAPSLGANALGATATVEKKSTFGNFANEDELNAKAEAQKTQEFKNSTGLETINADKAYALGYTGNGVTVGVVDSPVYINHPEIKDKVDLYGDDASSSALQNRDHGTHVVGIIAANRDGEENKDNMHGVAYNSHIKAIGAVEGTNGTHFDRYYMNYSDNLNDDVKVINNSWGGNAYIKVDNAEIDWASIDNEDFIKKLCDKDTEDLWDNDYIQRLSNEINQINRLWIFGSGNDDEIYPSQVGGLLGNHPNLRNNIINVVNYNTANGELGETSNLAKNASKYTITAPGTNINSLNDRWLFNWNYYDTMSGTSMAVPYVTGAVALIQESFPYLNGKQLGDTILSTANNDFKPQRILVQPKYTDGNFATNIIYIDSSKNLDVNDLNDENTIYDDLKNWYENNPNNSFQIYAKSSENYMPNFSKNPTKENFANDIIAGLKNGSNIGTILNLTKEEVYGQGLLDVGRAVQGPGYFDADRLSDDDKNGRYQFNKDVYLYKVNTQGANTNFHNRDYSIWSNDIGEKNTNGLSVGLQKSGDVDLILLGENTYTGPTVVTDGKLQIVRQVLGDVFADTNFATAEINGAAKNVFALNGGTVNVKDYITQKVVEESILNTREKQNADWYNKALPKTNNVNIDGGLFAIGNNANINVDLLNGDSVIKGALHQGTGSNIEMSLANGARFILEPIGEKSYSAFYDDEQYTSNNTLNSLTLNNMGIFDTSQNNTYDTITINNLKGNDGVFKINTDINNDKSDLLNIVSAEGTQSHFLDVVDKSGHPSGEYGGKSVLVATAPNNVTFKGLTQPVGDKNYTPMIDYLDGNGWHFYGFENMPRTPINDVVTASGIYTTDDVLNKGINSNNLTIKVNKGNSPEMLISSEMMTGKKIAIQGQNIKFIGDGDVKVTAYNQGLNINNFSANQNFNVDIYGYDVVGISNGKDSTLKFNRDLNVKINSREALVWNGGSYMPDYRYGVAIINLYYSCPQTLRPLIQHKS